MDTNPEGTPMTRLVAFSLVLSLGLFAATSDAAAKGAKDPAVRTQIRQLLTDFRTQRKALQGQVKTCNKDYMTAVGLALALDEAGLDALETQLDAAWELAEDRFEALPDADQLPATLRAYILEELKTVTDAATADAAVQAQLDGYSTTFVDCILPIKAQIKTLRTDTRAAIRTLLGK
jgi:hypothetical protein